MLTLYDYLQDPCRSSSLPWWKMSEITIPEDMVILHDTDFDPSILDQYSDDPYFRLLHPLQSIQVPKLPEDFEIRAASPAELSAHIDSCYGGIGFTEESLLSFTARDVYAPECWLAVAEKYTGIIVASGICEIDKDIREGSLEWVQVSADYRHRGLGRYIVLELLHRMRGKSNFVTVSGRCNNSSNPEALYRSCGFMGTDIWHILHRKRCCI